MTLSSEVRRYRRRHGLRSAILVIATMALMVLAPVETLALPTGQANSQPPTNAQATDEPEAATDQPATQPTVIGEGEEQPDVQGEQPTATIAPPSGDAGGETQPVVEATDETLIQQPATTTFSLTISVFRCDHPTFDPYFSSNAQMIFDQCVGAGSGGFTIFTTMPVSPQSGNGLEFEIGPDLAIQEQVLPGYGNPIANCFILDANGNVADQIGPGEASGGFWKVGGVGGDVHCDWYQVDQGTGAVYIVNMACPAPLGFPRPALNELVSLCTSPAGSAVFGVQYGQVYSKTGNTGGEFNDVLFEGIYSGPIAIWAEPAPKFESARMFCQVNTIDGVEISPFAEVPVSAFRATNLTLGHGQRLHCSWFNIPEGAGVLDPGPPSATTQPTATPPGGVSSGLRGSIKTVECGVRPPSA